MLIVLPILNPSSFPIQYPQNNYSKFIFLFIQFARMPKVGGRRKKNRSHKELEVQQQPLTPKTFIFKFGKCSEEIKDLTHDLRKCFYPNTAMKLEDTNKMNIKSYLKAAKHYHVNHLIALQHSKDHEYVRFIKVGGGQMTFRIINFSRMKEVLSHGGQPFSYSFKEPLLVLNGFNESQQVKMIGKGLQELFPFLNLAKAKIENLKRVVSFTFKPKKKFIFFRQYKIIQTEAGVSSAFEKLFKKTQDLSNYRSLKEYFDSQQSSIQGTQNQQKINLVEVGPRMKLKFISYKESAGVLNEKQLELEHQFNEQNDNQIENQKPKIKQLRQKSEQQENYSEKKIQTVNQEREGQEVEEQENQNFCEQRQQIELESSDEDEDKINSDL